MVNSRVLVIPYPAQGHVIPLMEASLCLIGQGLKVTFVNTDFNHKRVVNSLRDTDYVGNQLHLVSIPDGMEPQADRNDLGKLTETFLRVMPGKLEQLIKDINGSGSDEITCVFADVFMGWALKVADKMRIRRAAFWSSSISMLALQSNIQKLIDDGIVDNNGTPMKKQIVQLSSTMPAMNPANFVWAALGSFYTQKVIFDVMIENNEAVKLADWLVCNSTYDLEPAASALVPEVLTIGPLLARNRLGSSLGNFWSEDTTSLKWLDQHPPCSVIYVAFGSFTVFDKLQFQELALGLELSNRPFLWVVRPDLTDGTNDAYPKGYQERIATRGKMVGWAPQQKVLAHPSVACFMSHCGWNSTMEGVSNGVPFLCWPYFADQFLNETYICDVWKIGLNFDKDESGIISHGEVEKKLGQLLSDENIRARSLELKKAAVNNITKGGLSSKNLNNFAEWFKAETHCSF